MIDSFFCTSHTGKG